VIRIDQSAPAQGSRAQEGLTGHEHGADYQNLHRNKCRLRLNLKDPAGFPCSSIYSMDQVSTDPRVRELDMAAPAQYPSLGRLELVASPINFDRSPRCLCRATPDARSDAPVIRSELGYGAVRIADLKARRNC
jgi:crotonobetainyl-CoA:carnitine CoA-transferase CaiB-like acyl-CoA transferase